MFRFAVIGILLWTPPAQAQNAPGVVISQVYGGGGNSGATLTTDFVELFNRGTQSVDISGWSIQYASATGSTWLVTRVSGRIEPGQYYLVSQARGAGGSVELPRPDATGSITMSATAGKVALVRATAALTGAGPGGSEVVDFVGFGETNASLGQATPALGNTTAAVRRGNGCTDTRNNAADFQLVAPQPRNSASPRNLCAPPQPPAPSITELLNGASQEPGPIAPGLVVTIRGTGLGPADPIEFRFTPDAGPVPTTLGGTRVLFNGVAAPVVRSSSDAVTAIAPAGLTGRTSVGVQVDYRGQVSARLEFPVSDAAPAIFTVDGSGANLARAWTADDLPNSSEHPASPTETIAFLVTGVGSTAELNRLKAYIGGVESTVVSVSGMPGYPLGYARITVTVPERLSYGGKLPIALQIGDITSQYGVDVAIAGPVPEPGTGDLIERQLTLFRSALSEFPVSEIPGDTTPLPKDRLGIISWNVQVGGTSPELGAERPPMVKDALQKLFAGTYQMLVAQEIPNEESAEVLRTLLPGGAAAWQASFQDTPDGMDNGIWYRNGMVVREGMTIFTDSGTAQAEETKSLHPPRMAHVTAGDFDFTMMTVHLTFADGDTRESARELGHLLDYLDEYFNYPGHDPDLLVCGDFNLQSSLSREDAPHDIYLDEIIAADPRFQKGERRFATTVTTATSRKTRQNGGGPSRNLDHCLVSADALEELVQVRRVDPEILLGHPEDPEERLTSDHFPVAAFFRMRGENVARDNPGSHQTMP